MSHFKQIQDKEKNTPKAKKQKGIKKQRNIPNFVYRST